MKLRVKGITEFTQMILLLIIVIIIAFRITPIIADILLENVKRTIDLWSLM